MPLPALILAIAALIGRGTPSPRVVSAIAEGCAAEAAAHPVDAQACAALVTVYMAHESTFRTGVYGDSGRSYGLLQLPAAWARSLDAAGQVRACLAAVRASSVAAVDSSPSRASRRVALAERLLGAVRAE
jgi:hypothetical protein